MSKKIIPVNTNLLKIFVQGMKYFRGARPAEYTPTSPCQCKKFVLSNKDNPPLVVTIHTPSSYRAVI